MFFITICAPPSGVVSSPPTPPFFTDIIMADEEEQYQELQEMPIEHQMEERLVEALGHHVQDSVNWALIQALKPFTQPLANFGRREFLGEGSQQPRLQSGNSREVSGLSLQHSGGSSSAEIRAQMSASVLHDHEYGGFPPQETSTSFPQASFSQMIHPHLNQSRMTRSRIQFRAKSNESHDIPGLK
ncbi:hypothetical protein NDU88_000338 [Pleurodeles waltl]|uniref:Uncharacterized protein n=1 Tax=Pleurodeles waltl TaxID=8319 RepID=A0AAV7KQ02_PLEWA|nr:hypothetical protein NDU88_000338 [Pleurodeles waltl]